MLIQKTNLLTLVLVLLLFPHSGVHKTTIKPSVFFSSRNSLAVETKLNLQDTQITILPYGSTGFRYLSASRNSLPNGYEQPTFDDSQWTVGDAAFGSGGGCSIQTSVRTSWSLFSDLAIRKLFDLPANVSNVQVWVAIDNDFQLFINGHEVSNGINTHEGCAAYDSFVLAVPSSFLNPGSNLLVARGIDRGSESFLDVKITGDVPSLPTGHITSPQNNDTIGPATVFFTAQAQDNSGTGIKQVDFNVFYSGNWHSASIDTIVPYEVTWQTPNNLSSQQLQFAIHVTDNADNQTEFAGGIHRVNYFESLNQSNISENWVPIRAYLNQRSLSNGDVKCSVSSMAMILAMNGLIASDYSTMAAKADEMYPNVLINGDAYIWKMRNELRDKGAIAAYHEDSLDRGWDRIKQEIDAGRPVIVRTVHGTVTAAGHILAAVGYREEGTDRRIIAYDPFGRWLGNCCQNNYNLNSTDPTSYKGQWVFYDFPTIFGNSNYLITASNPSVETILSAAISTPSTPPDQVSGEPETIGTYEGIDIEPGSELFLPLILK